MAPKPQRQHYISKFLIKQWADAENNVGVVCQYHRRSTIVPASSLHYVGGLWSSDLENKWSSIENRAKDVLDHLKRFLKCDGEDWAAVKTFLSERPRLEALVDLVLLHHSRSLQVPMQEMISPSGAANSAEYESIIEERWRDAKSFHDGDIQLHVLSPSDPVGLGAIPVFNTPSWGVSKTGIARFVMPLTPRLLILGTFGSQQGNVEIGSSDFGFAELIRLQVAGEFKMLSTPYLICKPSDLERTARHVLACTEGSHWHWLALRNRIDLCGDDAPDALRRVWSETIRRYENNQRVLEDPDANDGMKDRARSQLPEDARKIQTDLDARGASICACKQYRASDKTSHVWDSVIPQVLCDAVRREEKTRHSP